MSTLASFMFVGACMGGGQTADKTELGATPASSDPAGGGGGGGGGGNISARFAVTPLTSDQQNVAPNVDPQLVDVWGVTSLEERFWAVAQETGVLIGLQADGSPTDHIPFVEDGQPATKADKTVTGITVNTSDQIQMDIAGNCDMVKLIVAAQSGRLWGVNPDLSTDSAFVLVDRSSAHAQYTGVALIQPSASSSSGSNADDGGSGGGGTPPPSPTLVLAVDFHNARVDVFNENFDLQTGPDAPKFVIPNLPKNFAPFGIFATADRVILTAAQRRAPAAGEPNIDQQVPGDGKGIVAAFDLTGTLLWRTESDMFNTPWGMAMGDLRLCATGALLVGQHGDPTQLGGKNNQFGGAIIAMDIRTGRVVSALQTADQTPVQVQGLWGLTFATDISNVASDLLHMGAGPVEPRVKGKPMVTHGLFARLDPTP